MCTRKLILKRVLRASLMLLLAMVLAFALLAYDVYSYRGDAITGVADAAVVLGAALDGDQPSPVFRERINHGIFLLQSGKVRWLILTGGCPQGCNHAESLVARQYALRKGVREDQILAETRSHTTYQNLYYARDLARAINLNSLVVVSDPFHLRRAMRMARDLGLHAQPAPTPTSRLNELGFLMRETWTNGKYVIHHSLVANAEAAELAIDEH